MRSVPVGSQGLETSQLALGCMGMSEFYIGATDAESRATIQEAVELGITLYDTADMYGPFTNERLLGECLRSCRDRVQIATKFGYVRGSDGTRRGLCGSSQYVKSACDASLLRLRCHYIDLYYLHRVDRSVPIEETVGAMADLVHEGKVRFIGLSEVSPATLRRAHSVFPISAVQTEYSLLSRDPERELLSALESLGVGLVAYAPLGRGLLSGRFHTVSDVPEFDYRRTTPRFAPGNLEHNSKLVKKLEVIAADYHVTPAQMAIAWLKSKVTNGVILIGTAQRRRLAENLTAMQIELNSVAISALDDIFTMDAVRGARYTDMSRVDG